jgi:hypothetical protein
MMWMPAQLSKKDILAVADHRRKLAARAMRGPKT